MIVYLTFNDPPTGVFYSQVIDVVNFYNNRLSIPVKLVSFISVRNFFATRKKIRAQMPDAIVLPMVPKLKNWRMNSILLKLVLQKEKADRVISRGPYATVLALNALKGRNASVVFDGRGAYSAELQEYQVVEDEEVKQEISSLESKAVTESDFRLAVSHKLVNYWERDFGYSSSDHVIIPCTLKRDFFDQDANRNVHSREKLGYKKDDIILVYSGSSAGWQSFGILDDFLLKALESSPRIHCLLLAQTDPEKFLAQRQFPGRIRQMWVPHGEVKSLLSVCDYGILIREHSVTNEVASPTKFAEYLSQGLPVLISEKLGDFSGFVKENNCGMEVTPAFDYHQLKTVSPDEKARMRELAERIFTKDAYVDEYRKIAGEATHR